MICSHPAFKIMRMTSLLCWTIMPCNKLKQAVTVKQWVGLIMWFILYKLFKNYIASQLCASRQHWVKRADNSRSRCRATDDEQFVNSCDSWATWQAHWITKTFPTHVHTIAKYIHRKRDSYITALRFKFDTGRLLDPNRLDYRNLVWNNYLFNISAEMLANVSVLKDFLLFRDKPDLCSNLFNMDDITCFITGLCTGWLSESFCHWILFLFLFCVCMCVFSCTLCTIQ